MITGLERFRLDHPGQTAAKTPRWVPLERSALGNGVVLAFDQSIRSTGWAVVVNHPRLPCVVREAGTISTRAGEQRGWESTLADAEDVAARVMALVRGMAGTGLATLQVVHEIPPASGRMARPESSALAALAVRIAAAAARYPVAMVGAQSAKHLLTGRRDADKPDVRAALEALAWLENRHLLTNEGRRDAAALALTWLTRHAPKRG